MGNPFTTGPFRCCTCPTPPDYDPDNDDPLNKYIHTCFTCPGVDIECVSLEVVANLCGGANYDDDEIPRKYYKKVVYFDDRATPCNDSIFRNAIVTRTYSINDNSQCVSEYDYDYVFVDQGNYYKTYTETLSDFELNTSDVWTNGAVTTVTPVGEIKDVVTVGSDDNGCWKLTYSYLGSLSFTYDYEECVTIPDGGGSIKEAGSGEGTLGRVDCCGGYFESADIQGFAASYDDDNCSQGEIVMFSGVAGYVSAGWNTRSARVYSNQITPELGYFEEDTDDDALARAEAGEAIEGTSCNSIYELRTTETSFTKRTVTYTATAKNLVRGVTYQGCVRIRRRMAYSGIIPDGTVIEWEDVEPDTISPFTATNTEQEVATAVELPIEKGYQYEAYTAFVWPVSAGCDCPTSYVPAPETP